MRQRSRRAALASLACTVTLAGCGGGGNRPAPTPADGVRTAVRGYLGALAARDWDQACRLMTPAARRDLGDAAGASCARALASGPLSGAELESARRGVAGADVRVRGASATIGPLGPARQALRMRRAGGRWLVAG